MAKPSPTMIVTAMETKNASWSSGTIPRMVVAAAMETGISRLRPESTTEWKRSFPLAIWVSISSIKTMEFLISIPIRLRRPSSAMKPKGMLIKNAIVLIEEINTQIAAGDKEPMVAAVSYTHLTLPTTERV